MSTTFSSKVKMPYSRDFVEGEFSRGKINSPEYRALIVDANPAIQSACQDLSSKLGISIHTADSFAAAQKILSRQHIDLVVLDLNLSESEGLHLLEGMRASHPELSIVIATASATVNGAVQAMRLGASDFLATPLAMDELTEALVRASTRRSYDMQARALHQQLSTSSGMGALIGRAPAMEKLYRIVSKVAFTTHPVLILGASGTGKELVARTIHYNGPNANRPFVPIYCGALTAETMERELFGYARGAFPEATRAKAGLLVEADGGTVFFDGVSELPLELQGKLVRVLHEREVRPVGSKETVPMHARILASAENNLADMQQNGTFRRDLYFRLNVVNINVPALSERREDIPLLANHVLRRIRQETGIPYELNTEAQKMLQAYNWPGNVRELESALERACVMASDPFLTANELPSQLQQHFFAEKMAVPARTVALPGALRVASIAELEKQAILNTIQQFRGDKLKAARLLGIGKTTLYRKLKEYGIEISSSN